MARRKLDVKGRRVATEQDTATDVTPALTFQCPESTSIRGASYNPVDQVLTVHFVTGNTYDHAHFTMRGWEQFYKAESKGSYYARAIRPNWVGVKRESR